MLHHQEPGPAKKPLSWQGFLYWVTIVAGVILCGGAYLFFRDQQAQRLQEQLRRCVAWQTVKLGDDLGRYEAQLYALGVLFDYSDEVSRREFQGAARVLRNRFRGIQALEWVPRVAAPERAAFEARVRSEGYPDFQITERDERGRLGRARERAEYWPICFVEPMAGNEPALGYDLKTGPTTNELARASGSTNLLGSAPISLVQANAGTPGWILILPVHRRNASPGDVAARPQNLLGYLQGVFRLEDIFNQAWGGDVYAKTMDLLVVDETDRQAPRTIYHRSAAPAPAGADGALIGEFKNARAEEVPFLADTRQWRLFIRPTALWYAREKGWYAESFAVAGLLLVVLVAVNLRAQRHRAVVVERLVEVRTTQLRRVNQQLQRRMEEQRRTRGQLEEVQENRLRLAAAVEQASEMVLFCDGQGIIRYVNPAFTALTGYAEPEVLGQPFEFAQIEKPSEASFAALVKKVAETGGWRGSFQARKKAGGSFTAEVTVSPVKDRVSQALHYIVLARDVTKEQQLEEQVRLAQKMEAIGLLAGGVAHDFNNLLQVILGYTALAMDASVSPPERGESLLQVHGAAERASGLTRQLLAFGRRQALQKEDLDLGGLIRDLLQMIRRIIGEHIEIDLIPGHQLGHIRADRSQVEQVVLNLCVNARDAMPKGGRLTIELENVLVNGSFRESHPWARPGRYVLMSILDTGVGMDKETQARIFEPFFSTKPKEQGTGLGLAVVYGIVKQHDGMIHVYSEPGLGSTFKVYLPTVQRVAAAVGPKLAPIPRRGHETILLVEDETAVRTLAAKVLERAGYRVLLAADGLEACAVFERQAENIALILMDVVMPRMGGREAYERIAARTPGIPVIYCSGYSEGALHGGFELPEDMQMIQKPYVPDELLRKLRSVLDVR